LVRCKDEQHLGFWLVVEVYDCELVLWLNANRWHGRGEPVFGWEELVEAKESLEGGGGDNVRAPSNGVEPFVHAHSLLLDVLSFRERRITRERRDVVALRLKVRLQFEELEVGAFKSKLFLL
jgi:hypothetical protein